MRLSLRWTGCALGLLALGLTACVGGSLRTHPDLEEYPLRSATESEAARLKPCLRAGHAAMETYRKRHGRYPKRASELPIDAACNGFFLGLRRSAAGYELMAQFHENEQTVRWTVNQDGVIEEHLDEEIEDLEL